MEQKKNIDLIFSLLKDEKFELAYATLLSLMTLEQKIIYLIACLETILPIYKLKNTINRKVEAGICAAKVYVEDYLGDNISRREPCAFASYAASAGEEAFTEDEFSNSFAHSVKHLLYGIENIFTYSAYNNIDKYLNWSIEELCNCIKVSKSLTNTTHKKLINAGVTLIL